MSTHAPENTEKSGAGLAPAGPSAAPRAVPASGAAEAASASAASSTSSKPPKKPSKSGSKKPDPRVVRMPAKPEAFYAKGWVHYPVPADKLARFEDGLLAAKEVHGMTLTDCVAPNFDLGIEYVVDEFGGTLAQVEQDLAGDLDAQIEALLEKKRSLRARALEEVRRRRLEEQAAEASGPAN
jgi:hypothetical protein